jgi:hypothetical protein
MGNLIGTKADYERIWDGVGNDFPEMETKTVTIDEASFLCVHAPWFPDKEPRVCIQTGLSFLAGVRLAVIHYRFVLQPINSLTVKRWEIQHHDILDWVCWAKQMNYIVTFSTLKSGAGYPLGIHAQSIPYLSYLTNHPMSFLPNISRKTIVPFETMPRFLKIQISLLEKYPAPALCLESDDSPEGLLQITEKAYELALNYDQLKAFNLAIIPSSATPQIYFFPRRRDGHAIFGNSRWQVAGLEFAGILLCREKDKFEKMDKPVIRELFDTIAINREEFDRLQHLVSSF